MKNSSQHLITEVPRIRSRVEMTIGVDLGDVWSHYCTLNQDGEVLDRGRFRTTPKAITKWFTDLPSTRVAMEARVHSIWITEQLQELGHEVIVANVRELRAISYSDRKSDQVDAEKLARYARLDPNILRLITHRTVEQQEALTLIRARALLVRLRTAAVNAARGLTKACGYRMPASSTTCFAQRSPAVMPPGLTRALGPVLQQIAEMTIRIRSLSPSGQRNVARMLVNTMVLFVGLRENGELDAFVAMVKSNGVAFTIVPQRAPMSRNYQPISLSLGAEAGQEFLNGSTERGREAQQTWRENLHVNSRGEYTEQLVIGIVRYIIQHPPKTQEGVVEVGGSMAAIELKPNSKINWLRPCPR
jgi:transposase